MNINPYLCFEGRSEEAINFYCEKLGAKVELMMRFKDAPNPSMCAPGNEDKVMHATLSLGESTLMISDGQCSGNASFSGITLSIAAADAAEAKQYFDALAETGKVMMPLAETFWSPAFGMLSDEFGVAWMVNCDQYGVQK